MVQAELPFQGIFCYIKKPLILRRRSFAFPVFVLPYNKRNSDSKKESSENHELVKVVIRISGILNHSIIIPDW